METMKWSDLPKEIQSRKIVNRSELPSNFDIEGLPRDVTITALTGEALAASERRWFRLQEKIGTRVAEAGLTEEQVVKLLNGIKSGE